MNVLFLCTGSARSILAECLLTSLGSPDFRGFSAGSQPVGKVNRRCLAGAGAPRHCHRPAAIKNMGRDDAPAMDAIITVCDNAAGEACPVWPGHPATAHWGLPDPAAVTGDEQAIDAAFEATYTVLAARIGALVEFGRRDRTPAELGAKLQELADLYEFGGA